MKLTLNITEEHIQLIKAFRVQWFNGNRCGINKLALYQGSYLYEDMARILGYEDKKIPDTDEDVDGPKYDADTTKHLDELADDIEKNLLCYEEILHQFCDKGGIKAGKYTCFDNIRIWTYEE